MLSDKYKILKITYIEVMIVLLLYYNNLYNINTMIKY